MIGCATRPVFPRNKKKAPLAPLDPGGVFLVRVRGLHEHVWVAGHLSKVEPQVANLSDKPNVRAKREPTTPTPNC